MLKHLRETDFEETDAYGGKAATLGRLMQEGFPVPEGFVIHSKLSSADMVPEDTAEDMKREASALDGDWLAVRSSANIEDGARNSFAGLFESFLIPRDADVVQTVRNCHSYREADRVQQYCHARGVSPEEIRIGVIVQEVVESDQCGVCFTKNPVNGNDNVLIEAVQGMVYSEQDNVTPDKYMFSRDLTLEEQVVNTQRSTRKRAGDGLKQLKLQKSEGEKPVLSEQLAKTVCDTALAIESCLGYPVDVEWAVENDALSILQARPITT